MIALSVLIFGASYFIGHVVRDYKAIALALSTLVLIIIYGWYVRNAETSEDMKLGLMLLGSDIQSHIQAINFSDSKETLYNAIAAVSGFILGLIFPKQVKKNEELKEEK